MIPRFKPYFDSRELKATFSFVPEGVVEKFESEFARLFNARYAISFRYGRSAIYAFLKALNIENAKIIMPAYTCTVVADAVITSGNIPHFVDISLIDYNLNLEEVKRAINSKTKVIIPGNTFGYPTDVNRLQEIIKNSGQKIFIVQDCAHAFGAKSHQKLVCNQGDAAIFGLGISKQISSIFGGMLITNNIELYEKIKEFRDKNFKRINFLKYFKELIYFLAVYLAFNKSFYWLTYQFDYSGEGLKFLRNLTNYYRKGTAVLPSDALTLLTSLEARIGLAQLKKYPEISEKKKFIAKYYNDNLKDIPGLTLPPIIEGATYSHYVPRIKNRERIIKEMKQQGVQLGKLIEYSVPHLEAYRRYKDGEFPNSYRCSRTTINLPNYPGLTDHGLVRIVGKLKHVLNCIIK